MRPEVETLNWGLKASAAQLVTWKWLETLARIPWVLAMVPVTLSGLQLVGLMKSAVDQHVDLLDLEGDAVLARRERAVGDGQLRGLRVDADGGAYDFAVAGAGTEVERAGVLGDVDREAERGAIVRAGEEHPAALDEDRFGAGAGAGGHFADLLAAEQVPSAAWGSPQSGTPERLPERPGVW